MDKRLQEINGFILRAKRATYAGDGPKSASSRPQSQDFHYAEPELGLLYIDSYLGGSHFAGEEAVWHLEKPLWAMNYCGHTTGEGFDSAFLKAALLQAPEEAPLRGPIEYQEGSLLYVNNCAGDMGWFFGREEIFSNGVSVYECVYHGGIIM